MRAIASLCIVASLCLGGCASLGSSPAEESPDRSGALTGARPGDEPPHLLPAFIYEINGERVMHTRERHRLEPGRHVIRAWPNTPEAEWRLVPDPVEVRQFDLALEAVEIEVEPGTTYVVAVRRESYQVAMTHPDGTVETGRWHHTIHPVVVDAHPPTTLEEAAIGFGSILLSLGAAALIVPLLVAAI